MLFFVGRIQVNSLFYQVIGICHPLRALVGFLIFKGMPTIENLFEEI
jgi:hypothetical protein